MNNKKFKCLDCGIDIWHVSIRCKSCARKFQYKNNPETHPFKGKHHTKCSLKKISKASKKMWKEEVFRNKTIKSQMIGRRLFPNKPETIVKNILNKISKKFKYVGNGQQIINGYNPDFISKREKKIIEVYGDYWHNRPEIKIRDKKKLKIYKKLGYKVLILWVKELRKMDQVIEKLESFI